MTPLGVRFARIKDNLYGYLCFHGEASKEFEVLAITFTQRVSRPLTDKSGCAIRFDLFSEQEKMEDTLKFICGGRSEYRKELALALIAIKKVVHDFFKHNTN